MMTLLGRPYLVISRLATPQTHNGRAWWRSAREPWGVGQAALRGLLSCSPRLEIHSLNPLSSCKSAPGTHHRHTMQLCPKEVRGLASSSAVLCGAPRAPPS